MSPTKPLFDLLEKKDWQKLGIDHAVFTTCGFYFPRVVGHLLAKRESPGQQRDSNQLPNPKTDQSCVLFLQPVLSGHCGSEFANYLL